VLPAKHLVTFMRKWRTGWQFEMKHLLDIEMVIMEDLNFDLVVFSPYRSLSAFLLDSAMGEATGLRAWMILNDSYRTDVSLLNPPHLVALACLQLAVVHLNEERLLHQEDLSQRHQSAELQRLGTWMESLNVDLDRLYDIVVDITTMYEKYPVPLSVEVCNRLLDAVCGRI